MALNPYRRHTAECPHRTKGMDYTRCNCPIWVYGTTDAGETVRESLKTRDWSRVAKRIDQREKGLTDAPADGRSSYPLARAVADFIAASQHRNVSATTRGIYECYLQRRLLDACTAQGITTVDQLKLGSVL